ncbi:MAG: gfo/Idh/MocA family oxidoreductase [Planctomycetota bacterium]|nr:gfo/Idh/MocA family oxidoreductase [Planctomycetota bacterium]
MLRLGVVDFDSSHSIEFTRRINHCGVDADQCVEGARVVLGCPGDSQMSPERIPGFTREVESCGVELVEQPTDMIGRIDGVLVLSICGSAHLQRVRPFLEAGIPAYVDKPFACSLPDATEIFRLANEHRQVVFGTSALRFSQDVLTLSDIADRTGRVLGAFTYGPAKRADGNPGLFHYGIHATEVLFALMGSGCESVVTAYTDGAEVVTGRWRDGRVGTLRGSRDGSTSYGFVAFCERAVIERRLSTRFAYRNLCQSIVRSFETGVPTVDADTTLEVVRFVLAALASESRQGESVRLDSIQ